MTRYLLNQGDLRQLCDQERFLRNNGFDVKQESIFPSVGTKDEYVQALKEIYHSYVNGWWNYKEKNIRHGICTEEEFNQKFRAYMEKERK